MDKTSESYAQKILAEIKKIAEPIKSHSIQRIASNKGSHEQQDSADQCGDRPEEATLGEQVSTKGKPPDAHNKNPEDRDEKPYNKLRKHKPLIEFLGLVFLVLYTTIAALQWCVTSKQANEAIRSNTLLEESIRAQMSLDTSLDPVEAGKRVSQQLTITNIGHSVALVTTHYGYDRRVELPDGDMPLDPGSATTILEPGKPMYSIDIDPHLISQSILDNMTPISDMDAMASGKPRSLTIYLYGRIDYKTFGKTKTIEFCHFLAKNDGAVVYPKTPPDSASSAIENSAVVLMACPKWNGFQ